MLLHARALSEKGRRMTIDVVIGGIYRVLRRFAKGFSWANFMLLSLIAIKSNAVMNVAFIYIQLIVWCIILQAQLALAVE